MYKIRDCPLCGNPVEIKIVLREYGFCGVVIQCPNCRCELKNGKCAEQIHEDGYFATPITEHSLSKCLYSAIRMWNNRSKRANEQDIGEEMCKDADDWKERMKHENA